MLDWQPIETVPIDEVVMIWGHHGDMAIAWVKSEHKALYYFPSGGAIGWRPTHWASLPKGPKEWHAKQSLEVALGLRH